LSAGVEPSLPQHEETIVPVRPDLRPAPANARRAPAQSRPRARTAFALLAAAALLLIAVVSFVWLPSWVAGARAAREQVAAAAAAAAKPPEPAQPTLSPEEIAALKTKAETLLTNLLTQQNRLKTQNVESWGGETWEQYSARSSQGDDAFLAEDFATAVTSYTDATALGDELLTRAVQTVDSALAAAAAAFAAGNAELALTQYDVVLNIDPNHAAAKAGRARAERLPEVLELVDRAGSERARGDLKAALATYREALGIDPDWPAARTAAHEVAGLIANAEYDHALSAGFAALAKERYNDAIREFQSALALRPNAREAVDGLTQAQHGQELDKIALTEARALAFERRELWDQAVAQYRGALAGDATLLFAQSGLERAENRRALDNKLNNLIDNPMLLFGDAVLADARKLLDEADAVEDPGPRLEEQMGKLEGLVGVASTPIPVRIESDQLTEVTLYRVGALGVFAAKDVPLRPGTYTAIGSRDGYRDVRRTFTVLPGRALPPITVACVEPI
jgi:tetratricopeptide (TPR) repeat protein